MYSLVSKNNVLTKNTFKLKNNKIFHNTHNETFHKRTIINKNKIILVLSVQKIFITGNENEENEKG